MLSGAGVVEETTQRDNAVLFLDFLVSDVAQQYLASSYQYPVSDIVVRPKGMLSHNELKQLAKRQKSSWPSFDERQKIQTLLEQAQIVEAK